MISKILLSATGEVLVEENADAPLNPASLTKMMTLYLVFNALPLDHEVVVPDHAVVKVRPGKVPQSRIHLKAGQRVSVCELVLGMIVASGNDAAKAVAGALGPDFLEQMASAAERMGLEATRFASASGLPGGTSTARDMARLAQRLHDDFPHYRPLFGVGSFAIGGRRFATTNDLMVGRNGATAYRGMTGLKTGTTPTLHRHLAASATREGSTLIGVVMNCPTPFARDQAMTKLLDQGYGCSDPH